MALKFRIDSVGGKRVVLHESGTKRIATPEESKLWDVLKKKDEREDELLTFIDKNAGKVDSTTILGWYMFLRLGEVKVNAVDPLWLNGVIRDYNRLSIPEVVDKLKKEFPDDFKVPKGLLPSATAPAAV